MKGAGQAFLLQLDGALRYREGAARGFDGMAASGLWMERKDRFQGHGRGTSPAHAGLPAVKKMYAGHCVEQGATSWMDKEKCCLARTGRKPLSGQLNWLISLSAAFPAFGGQARALCKVNSVLCVGRVLLPVPQEQILVPGGKVTVSYQRLMTDTTHYVDLFPNWNPGIDDCKSLKSEHRQRRLRG